MDKKSTFSLSPDQLARLMVIGKECPPQDDEQDSDEIRVRLLLARLESTLPPDPDTINSIPVILGRMCRDLLPHGAESVKKLLQNPQTDLSVIKEIKDYGKRLAEAAAAEPDRDAAITIYYAAIAAALAYHNHKITEHSYKDLDKSFSLLVNKSWMSADLIDLLKQAQKICRQRSK